MTEQTTTPVIPEFDLPDRLRKALRHAGVSVQEMGEYLEVSRNTVGSWINGKHRPPAAAIRVWADRCGVAYEWLAHGDAKGSHRTQFMRDQPTAQEILAHTKRIDNPEAVTELRRSLGFGRDGRVGRDRSARR